MEGQNKGRKGGRRNLQEDTTQSNSGQNRSNSGQNRLNSGQTKFSRGPTRFNGRNNGVKECVHVPKSTTNSAQEPPVSGIKSLEISKIDRRLPISRPESGGGSIGRSISISTNHFQVEFDPMLTIYHYAVNIEPKFLLISKSDAQLIKNKVITDNSSLFPPNADLAMAYDGKENIYSAVPLPAGKYNVTVPTGDDCKLRNYIFTIKLVKQLNLNNLASYFTQKTSGKAVPREILQALDLVMREHPSRCRIVIGRSFFSRTIEGDCDLGWGLMASKGFQQRLKPTDQGLGLVIDPMFIAFRKPIPVLAYLRENAGISFEENSTMSYQQRKKVGTALIGLKVKVNHRKTGQKYVIRGLTKLRTIDLTFEIENLGDENSKKITSIEDYFREKHEKEIKFKFLPCLDLSKKGRINYIPIEFCELVEGQIFPRERMPNLAAQRLKNLALMNPGNRYSLTCQIVTKPDGPCRGETTQRFKILVSEQMTQVTGRVLAPPDLKLGPNGRCSKITPRRDEGQWNLLGGNHVFDGKRIDRWAILYFRRSYVDQDQQAETVNWFAKSLSHRCINLGIEMSEKPVFTHAYDMANLNNSTLLFNALSYAHKCGKRQLQILICVMADKHPGYKNLKRIAETEIGIITQCCLYHHAVKCDNQYLANLALKINAKVGGSNVALHDRLPRLSCEDGSHVIFIGADVNHPSCHNASIPSMAAVVATINWPDANRYIARFQPQPHRTEKIVNLREMCRDILETYSRVNGKLPEKIIFFRDGVSDGQFDMVLNEELTSIKEAIGGGYLPTITFIVAQKRHQTRLFPADSRQRTELGNVPPGTVVDTVIVHPWEFDFYLCSHHGTMGTSRPTHYHVLWDEHGFSSDEMQRLIYNLCYTFARCTKPISLVPPVYYADLVAYRARQYLEGWLDSRSPASTASSPSSSSSSSSSSFFDYGNLLKLHSDLKGVMFF